MKKCFARVSASMLALAVSTVSLANESTEWVKSAALQVAPEVIALRHQIHQHPELGNQEFETSTLVA